MTFNSSSRPPRSLLRTFLSIMVMAMTMSDTNAQRAEPQGFKMDLGFDDPNHDSFEHCFEYEDAWTDMPAPEDSDILIDAAYAAAQRAEPQVPRMELGFDDPYHDSFEHRVECEVDWTAMPVPEDSDLLDDAAYAAAHGSKKPTAVPMYDKAAKFSGQRHGAVFKLGEYGLGYYSDVPSTPILLAPQLRPMFGTAQLALKLEDLLDATPPDGCSVILQHDRPIAIGPRRPKRRSKRRFGPDGCPTIQRSQLLTHNSKQVEKFSKLSRSAS